MRQWRRFGIFLAALAGAGSLTAMTTPGAAAQAVAVPHTRPAPAALPRGVPAFGNPDGHAWVPPAGRAVTTSHRIVLDGGGKVTLSGAGQRRILYMNTCDPKQKLITDDCWEQKWPQLIVQNITFEHAYRSEEHTSELQSLRHLV